MSPRDRNGFTLVEMLLVVIIISTLAAMVVPRFSGRSQEAKAAAAAADVRAGIAAALDLYELDNGVYPTTGQGLEALTSAPSSAPVPRRWRGPYLKGNKLHDPWGNPYVYRSPGQIHRGDYDLLSVGEDGVEGTIDDIANWDGKSR